MSQHETPASADDTVGRPVGQGARTSAAEVPEYPALAPNVELVGEMQETGFRDRQWLVQRGGRFIQLTELLYRVAEQADGSRTHGEMAEGVTESTEWLVSAENVRQLVGAKLLPLGLITPADGSASRDPSIAERRAAASPLRVNGRMKVLGPRAIDPVTKVLQVLFAPFVVIPVLAAVAFAHGWLYLAHGLGGAMREVIYAPGLALAVLAILFLSGVFHEFGHAAALRYGGGKARGMGAGFYLVYPALYTDTTDVYRLGRRAKLRTDLGGFYFHLIFALGLVALYLVTGWEFLLFAVLLINLDILYQCLPFVRFDGYWALADLTGIPDFFSQMGAFLKGLLPGSRRKGGALPNLKPWVKAVFALYVAVTVPVLSLLLFYLVTALPGILAAQWDSFLLQAREASFAINDGDAGGVTVAFLQALVVALQVVAISYLLYALGRTALRVLLTWSEPTATRRLVGALAFVAAVASVIFVWTT